MPSGSLVVSAALTSIVQSTLPLLSNSQGDVGMQITPQREDITNPERDPFSSAVQRLRAELRRPEFAEFQGFENLLEVQGKFWRTLQGIGELLDGSDLDTKTTLPKLYEVSATLQFDNMAVEEQFKEIKAGLPEPLQRLCETLMKQNTDLISGFKQQVRAGKEVQSLEDKKGLDDVIFTFKKLGVSTGLLMLGTIVGICTAAPPVALFPVLGVTLGIGCLVAADGLARYYGFNVDPFYNNPITKGFVSLMNTLHIPVPKSSTSRMLSAKQNEYKEKQSIVGGQMTEVTEALTKLADNVKKTVDTLKATGPDNKNASSPKPRQ